MSHLRRIVLHGIVFVKIVQVNGLTAVFQFKIFNTHVDTPVDNVSAKDKVETKDLLAGIQQVRGGDVDAIAIDESIVGEGIVGGTRRTLVTGSRCNVGIGDEIRKRTCSCADTGEKAEEETSRHGRRVGRKECSGMRGAV